MMLPAVPWSVASKSALTLQLLALLAERAWVPPPSSPDALRFQMLLSTTYEPNVHVYWAAEPLHALAWATPLPSPTAVATSAAAPVAVATARHLPLPSMILLGSLRGPWDFTAQLSANRHIVERWKCVFL